MSGTRALLSSSPRRPKEQSIELAFRGASAAALSRSPSSSSLPVEIDTLGAATPLPSTATFAQRARRATALVKQRQALNTQAAKVKQSLADLETLNLSGDKLWDLYVTQGHEYRRDVICAVLGSASLVGFLLGVGGVAGALKTARAMRETKAVLDAGGIAPQKAALEGQLAAITAQIEGLERRLSGT